MDARVKRVLACACVLAAALAFYASALPWPVTSIVALLVVAGAVALAMARFAPHTLKTQAGRAWVYTIATPEGPVRVMRVGGVYQSATYLDERRMTPVFAYQRALYDVVAPELGGGRTTGAAGPARRVLAIGGGGFAYPKYALTCDSTLALEVVEIDPAVVDAARRWFFLDELERQAGARLAVTVADGRAVLDGLAARHAAEVDGASEAASQDTPRYAAIVNDTFAGVEPVRALATVEAARAAHACLEPGGLYVTNVVSQEAGADVTFLRDEVATLAQVFCHVYVVPAADDTFGGEDNYVVVAADRALDLPDAIPFDDDFLGSPLFNEGDQN